MQVKNSFLGCHAKELQGLSDLRVYRNWTAALSYTNKYGKPNITVTPRYTGHDSSDYVYPWEETWVDHLIDEVIHPAGEQGFVPGVVLFGDNVHGEWSPPKDKERYLWHGGRTLAYALRKAGEEVMESRVYNNPVHDSPCQTWVWYIRDRRRVYSLLDSTGKQRFIQRAGNYYSGIDGFRQVRNFDGLAGFAKEEGLEKPRATSSTSVFAKL